MAAENPTRARRRRIGRLGFNEAAAHGRGKHREVRYGAGIREELQ